MQKIGEIYGVPVVDCEDNELRVHQIQYKKNEDGSVTLQKRDRGELKVVSGGSSNNDYEVVYFKMKPDNVTSPEAGFLASILVMLFNIESTIVDLADRYDGDVVAKKRFLFNGYYQQFRSESAMYGPCSSFWFVDKDEEVIAFSINTKPYILVNLQQNKDTKVWEHSATALSGSFIERLMLLFGEMLGLDADIEETATLLEKELEPYIITKEEYEQLTLQEP